MLKDWIEDIRHPRRRWGYIFMLPGIVYFAVFVAYPLIRTFSLSFFTLRGIVNPPLFVGLENYITILSDETFRASIFHTFYYTALTAPIGWASGLFVAFLFSTKFKFKNFWKMVYFLPSVTALIAVAVVWTWIYQPLYGLLNSILRFLNLSPQGWIKSPVLVIPSVAAVNIWMRTGFNMIIFLAGLMGIPQELYEVADIDGASTWHKFWYITFPLLLPTTAFVLIMSTINGLQVFTEIYIMTSGGPADSSRVVAFEIYQTAFKFSRMGKACAMAVVLFSIVLVFTVIQLKFFRKGEVRHGR